MHVHALCDPLAVEAQLAPEERMVRDSVARFVDEKFLPLAPRAFEQGRFPTELIPELGRLGILGATLQGHGCAGMGQVAYGLAMSELERGDSGLRSFASVQSALVMWPIDAFGSAEQKERWLPRMARGEAVGCFGLTEPDSGSDPASMRTRARKISGGWRLDGEKLWITNGTLAEVALVWARDDAGDIRGFLVPRDAPGFAARAVEGKFSMRISDTAALSLDGVELPDAALLPGARGLKAPLSCLTQARYGIAWGALGAAAACFACARDYARERVQFGRPIAAFQMVQQRLAEAYSQIGLMQLLCLRLGRLKEQGGLTPVQVSLAKRHCAAASLDIARSARELLGANGITTGWPVIRHLLNLETVKTYEGTHDIHTLVLGRAITGLDAFGAAP